MLFKKTVHVYEDDRFLGYIDTFQRFRGAETTRLCMPEDCHLHIRPRENLKSHKVQVYPQNHTRCRLLGLKEANRIWIQPTAVAYCSLHVKTLAQGRGL
jgi:hypothetical protein